MTAPRWLTPGTLTGDTTCRQFAIPLELLPMVRGAVDMLAQPWNWEEFGTATIDEVVAASMILSEALSEECNMAITPSRFHLSWPEGVSASGGAGAEGWVGIATCENGGVWRMSPAAIGDTISWKQPMRAGTYTAIFHTIRRTNGGIVQLKIDGANKGSLDTYGATLDNWVASLGTFTITTDAVHQVTLEVTGKNAASSSYFMYLDRLYLFQLASS